MSTLERKTVSSERKKIRLIFMGTPDFSLPVLNALIVAPEIDIVGVFTQTDKPVGRQQIVSQPPVKKLALKHNLSVYQPRKIKTEAETIKNLHPDIIVTIAYGQIIPPEILAIPTFGALNIHASLLPKYRGAACLNAPILNGDQETGITIMKMDAGLDTGPILRQAKMSLQGRETLSELHDNLSALGAEILLPTLRDYIDGKLSPLEQNNQAASYVRTIKKVDGHIDWQKAAKEIERMIRAYNPWPGTFTMNNGGNLKIIAVEHEILKENGRPIGQVFLTGNQLAVQCGQDSLIILKLQTEGKKITAASDFLNGNPNIIGQILK